MEQKDKQIYTIDDIAHRLGISKTTVSRAMSGKGRVSPATRDRVMEFIEQHNFRPNAMAKSLAQSRTYNLGLVMPSDRSVVDQAFFQRCMKGICSSAFRRDYDVLLTMDDDGSLKQLERIIENRKVDGMIVMRSVRFSPTVALLKQTDIPFILIGATDDESVLHVDNNNRAACRMLTAQVIGKGARHIALFGGESNFYVTHSRYAGFCDACADAGLSPEACRVYWELNTADGIARAIADLSSQAVDCILCMDDFICNMVQIQLRERGVRVPEDIWLASFYDSPLLEYAIPSVTALRFDAVELGSAACRALLSVLDGAPVESRTLPAFRLIERDSTKKQF